MDGALGKNNKINRVLQWLKSHDSTLTEKLLLESESFPSATALRFPTPQIPDSLFEDSGGWEDRLDKTCIC